MDFEGAVRVARFEGGLRGMRAVKDHRGDDGSKEQGSDPWVVRVPQPCALEVTSLPSSSLPFPEDNFAGVTREYWRAAPWFVKLALMLLYEKSLGSKSDLAPYIGTLPRSFAQCPIFWTDEELAQLQYPPLVAAVEEQRREVRREREGTSP